jgi:hypothetical protein
MKLDSEEYRRDLLEMLGTVRVTVTPNTYNEVGREFARIIGPIETAEIEEPPPPPPPEKRIVPIDFLAPDTPDRIRRFVGMPGVPGENGA